MSEPRSEAVETENGDGSSSALLKASGITGSMTMVSRFLGLARDIVIARLFGATDAADVFFLANKIPNFMRRLFAEGAFNQAFVPVLSEYRSTKSLAEVQNLIAAVAGSLGGFLFLLTAFMMVAAPLVAVPIGYGFTDEPLKFDLFVEMLRITFPYLLLISMTAFCSAILNSYGRFAIPAVPELALAWGVLIAGVAQLLFQLPLVARMQLLPRPRLGKFHEGVDRIKKLMVPALFGVSVSQINLLLDAMIASLLVTGSISWLYFSDRLMELPVGTFGIAVAIVVLPSLSRKHAESSMQEFSETLDWATKLICLVSIPATLALIILAKPLLVTLFQNDNFTAFDVEQSAGSLRAYSFGILAFMSIKIFAPGFYARQNTRTPVKIGVIALCANMIMNVLFYLNGMAHVGLALATSLAAYLNAGLLLRGLRREKVYSFHGGWLLLVLRLLLANSLLAFFLIRYSGDWLTWLDWDLMTRVIRMALLVFGGMALYVAALYTSGLRLKHLHR